jgi:hypothetical protein
VKGRRSALRAGRLWAPPASCRRGAVVQTRYGDRGGVQRQIANTEQGRR